MDDYLKQYIASMGVHLTQRLLSEDVNSIDEACHLIIEDIHRIEPSPMRLYLRNEDNAFEEKYYIQDKEIRKGDDTLPLYQLPPELVSNLVAMQQVHPGEISVDIPLRHGNKLIGFIEFARKSRLEDDMLQALDAYGYGVSLGLYVVKEKDKSERRQALYNRIMKILLELRSKNHIEELINIFVDQVSSYFRYDRTSAFIFNEQSEVQYLYSTNANGKPLTIDNVPRIPKLGRDLQPFDDICGWWLPIKTKEQIIGCVLVDNIYTLSSINENQLPALEELCSFVGIMIENIRLFNSIEKTGRIDYLTGIYNRRVGIESINAMIKNANNIRKSFALCFVDLNGLKFVNDTMGHNVGDQMIQDFVHVIKKVVRPRDVLSRIGGDEFIILLPDCNMQGAETAWHRILHKMNAFNKDNDKPYKLNASHGIVVYNPESNMTANRLLAIADKRMYKEKKQLSEV